MLKNSDSLYKEALEILSDCTPLNGDCGTLCESACCKGTSDEGMRLFPGEATTLSINGSICVCGGSCKRDLRPLACRIFPFFPTVAKDGRIKVKLDARAVRLCPLVAHPENVRFRRDFIKAVRKVGRLLQKREDTLNFLIESSKEIETYESLYGYNKTYSKRL